MNPETETPEEAFRSEFYANSLQTLLDNWQISWNKSVVSEIVLNSHDISKHSRTLSKQLSYKIIVLGVHVGLSKSHMLNAYVEYLANDQIPSKTHLFLNTKLSIIARDQIIWCIFSTEKQMTLTEIYPGGFEF